MLKKNYFRPFLSFAGIVLLAGFAIQTAQAAVIVVGTCKSGVHFTTISAAVAAAPVGGTIDVCPGTYPEQVHIAQPLKLVGIPDLAGHNAAVVVVPAGGILPNTTDSTGFPIAAQIFVDNTTGVTVSGLTIDGSNNLLTGCGIDLEGIYFKNSGGTISNNALRNQLLPPGLVGCQDGLAIFVEGNSSLPVSILTNSVRNYDKNGITVDGPGTGAGPNATIKGNTVIGLGATPDIAQNGIQIAYGATATISGNNVADNIYTGPTYGSSGILIYGSSGVSVSSNTVDSAQLAIVTVNSASALADGASITLNTIGGTQTFDAIDVCSNNNTVTSNIVHGSAESAIHLDGECPGPGAAPSGNGNLVNKNTMNEACAGILNGGTSNTLTANKFYNVVSQTLLGDFCPAVPVSGIAKSEIPHSLKPSPHRATR